MHTSTGTEMRHYFGYLFLGASGFLGIMFLVQFDFFRNNPHFWVLILIFYFKWHCGMLPAGLWFLIFFSQIQSILVKQNDNNKRIECFSNESTVFISILSCSCKEFHIVYNWYQFEQVYLQCCLILTSFYHCG